MSVASLYSGDRALDIAYVAGAPLSRYVYPGTDTYEVLGQLFAPRIYGRNLTAFEVASSGKLAMTMRDTHALDLDYAAGTSTVSIRTVSGDDRLELGLSNPAMGSLSLGNSGSASLQAVNASITAASNMGLAATAFSGTFVSVGLACSGSAAVGASNSLSLAGASAALSSTTGAVSVAGATDAAISAGHDVSVTAGGAFAATGATGAAVTASAGPVTVAGASATVSGSNGVGLTSFSNIRLAAPSIALDAASNLVATGAATARLVSGDAQLALSPTTASLAAPGRTVVESGFGDGYARVEMGADGSGGSRLQLAAKAAGGEDLATITMSTSNLLAVASQEHTLITAGSSLTLSASEGLSASAAKHAFKLGGREGMKLYTDAQNATVLRLDGRLDITGPINTTAQNETVLNVNDKTITLAFPPAGSLDVHDGGANTGAGILVYGVPESPAFSHSSAEVQRDYYKKGLLWNNGNPAPGRAGVDYLGTSAGVDYAAGDVKESFWEVRGGHLQMTIPRADGAQVRDLTYGFRINERGEIELFKRSWEGGQYRARRLARWGHGSGML